MTNITKDRSSKPVRPCESKVGRVRFPCPTERNTGTERQQAETAVSTQSPRLGLLNLALGADRAGLFCNFSPEPNTGCYLWTGRTTKQGYGVVCIERKTVPVHRAVYRLCVEEIGDDLDVHHICEQPGCIYPEHLTALTPEQHRRVHTGHGRAWNVFVERIRVDPFELGVFGFGLPTWFQFQRNAAETLDPAAQRRPPVPPVGVATRLSEVAR